MAVLTLPGLRHVGVAALRALHRLPFSPTRDLGEVADIYDSLKDPRARAAIRHVVRGVIDWKGQVVTMADRAYLTEAMPLCVIWGEDDQVIPARHLATAEQLAPAARIERFARSGHFPHRDRPADFVGLVEDFIDTTPPATYDEERLRRLLIDGPARFVHQAEAGEHPVSPVLER